MTEQEKKWNFDEYSWLESYDKRMCDTKRLQYDKTLYEVANMASIKEGDLVLDIGTGTGNLAVKFLENGQIVIGDVMFKDEANKIRALNEYPDMADEYQPTLDTFPDMLADEGFAVEIAQIADTVWIVCAEFK
jgi:cyclopropane fatty-acyl-phospholipid synthase-like methyltransferase